MYSILTFANASGFTEPAKGPVDPITFDCYTQFAYTKTVRRAPMTVVETERFLKDAHPLMQDSERMEVVAFVAANPEAGDIVPEAGGVRKLRWGLRGRGKRGGARVIYYYHSDRLPVFLLAAYAKNEKANLSKAERNAMKKLIPMLVEGYARPTWRQE
jgi:hypothetical protein